MSRDGADVVFLFSLPRSGSTLTQRLIGSHPDVATTSEPWLLLPLLYSLRDRGVYAEYGHRTAAQAIQDFCAVLPDGRAGYLDRVRSLVLDMYDDARDGKRLFLDKTPRYHLIAGEVLELFPAAKAIFLWRQPLAVAASIIETFGEGRWNLDKYAIDLYEGVDHLLAAQEANRSRSLSIRYEDVLARPQDECRRIFEYLGLDAPDGTAAAFADVRLAGRMGDQTGGRYGGIDREPLAKWTRTMANPVRRRWCRQYLDWLGPRLAAMGYQRSQLESALGAAPASGCRLVGDVGRIAAGYGYWRIADRLTGSTRRGLAATPPHQSPSS